MESIGERLAQHLEDQGITKKDFCEQNDLVYNNFVRVLKGNRALGMNVLNKIKKGLPNLNVNWLLYGQGKPILNESESQEDQKAKNDSLEALFMMYLNSAKAKELINQMIQENDEKKSRGTTDFTEAK